jgi:metallophosphoesterase superfamily enzyme
MPSPIYTADLISWQRPLAAIAAHANERPFKIVTLGDYVDRGPQSRQIIEHLMAAQAAGMKLICLKGNHEDMMYRALTPTGRASASRNPTSLYCDDGLLFR